MIFEPLGGRRENTVSEHRKSEDFVHVLKHTSDTLYPMVAEKIILVTDNLNTHIPTSLYKTFPPEEAHRQKSK